MKNTKWCFKNSRHIGKIEGKLWTLKMIVSGHNDNRLNSIGQGIEEIEELINKIEI